MLFFILSSPGCSWLVESPHWQPCARCTQRNCRPSSSSTLRRSTHSFPPSTRSSSIPTQPPPCPSDPLPFLPHCKMSEQGGGGRGGGERSSLKRSTIHYASRVITGPDWTALWHWRDGEREEEAMEKMEEMSPWSSPFAKASKQNNSIPGISSRLYGKQTLGMSCT